MEHRLATDDEEFPIGFSDATEDGMEGLDDWDDFWDGEEDSYDFPEDDGGGLFDPMEAEREPS